MAVTAPVFPARTPISAPANNIIPFTRGAPLPSGAPVALAGQPPLPAIRAPLPPGATGILARGVPINAPNLAPAAGVAVAPAANVSSAVGGASLLGALGGAVAGVIADLVFPAVAYAPEAPTGINSEFSPSQQAPSTYPPISLPAGGIRADGLYIVSVAANIYTKANQQNTPANNNAGSTGADIPNKIANFSNVYQYENQYTVGTIQGFSIALQTPGTQPPTFPDYRPFQKPSGTSQPLQDPVPVDSNGQRKPRAFVPPPRPAIVPFTRPATRPANPPQPAPQTVPSVPPDIVPPIVTPELPTAPPIPPPFPFPNTPFYPYPVPLSPVPGKGEKAPFAPLAPIPGGLTVTPSTTPPRVPFTPDVPVEETGKLKEPWIEPVVPPVVPPTKRQRGADCCDSEPASSGEDCCDEILEKLKELHDCVCKKDRQVISKSLGSGDSGSYSLPDDTIAVVVSVTDITSGVRSQSGNAQGKEIYYVGSYAFGMPQGHSDRNPISFESNVFFCPERSNRFQFQLNFGSTAEVSALYLKPLPP